ncbi:MAG TPA: hypothetical protein VM364_03760 [Vicinamibacterales bacterium]|nr:hypothetical protein [Vicinamibacterales bacterium]
MHRSFVLGLSLFTALALAACTTNGESNGITGPAATAGSLQTLVDVTTGLDVTAGGTGTWNWAGQSFVVPGSGSFGDLRFHWYAFQKTPAAFGRLYLLTQEFLGVPGDLGPSTPGFVARSEGIADNVYVFAPQATISGGTKYWVYTDAQGAFAGSFDTDIYPGGDMYLTGYHANPFRKAQASGRMVNGVYVPPPPGVFIDANFKLQARPR